MFIAGLDLSLKCTGVVVLGTHTAAGRLVKLTSVRTRKPDHNLNGWEVPRRHRRILVALAELIPPGSVVVKEGRIESLDVAGNSALDLAGLHAVVDYFLLGRGCPIVSVNLVHVKIYATGSGRAEKDDMVLAAGAELAHLSQVFNDNEADAFWLAAMGWHHYQGGPITKHAVNTRRTSVLDKVVWHNPTTAVGGNP